MRKYSQNQADKPAHPTSLTSRQEQTEKGKLETDHKVEGFLYGRRKFGLKLIILFLVLMVFTLELMLLPNPWVGFNQSVISSIGQTNIPTSSIPKTAIEANDALTATLNSRQKAGQLFLTSPSGLILTQTEKEWLGKGEISGFVLLGKNIKDEAQVKTLTAAIMNAATPSGIKPVIAVDQEGGRVSRIPWINKMAQQEISSQDQAWEVGLERGRELKNLGISVNLAPVVETGYISQAYIAKEKRTFATHSAQLSQMMVKGLLEAGILPVIKHYPGGLGRVASDPHLVLPQVMLTGEELAADLDIFRQVIDQGAPALMVTHLVYPTIDPLVVAQSPLFMHDLLREKLRFEGIVIVDDLSMGAVDKTKTPEMVIESLKVGADMFIVTDQSQYQELVDNLTNTLATSSGVLQESVDRSVIRVLETKKKWL